VREGPCGRANASLVRRRSRTALVSSDARNHRQDRSCAARGVVTPCPRALVPRPRGRRAAPGTGGRHALAKQAHKRTSASSARGWCRVPTRPVLVLLEKGFGRRFERKHRGSSVHSQERLRLDSQGDATSWTLLARSALRASGTNAPRGRARSSRRTRSAIVCPLRALPRAFGRGGGVHDVQCSKGSPGRSGGTRR
jgi:hypothetical protein